MRNIKVLIIDDEEELVTTLVERLEYRNIDAVGALTGQEGLNLAGERTFDLVLLDLKLPGMSGLEVLRQLKREQPGVKVLLITGHGATSDDDEVVPEGAFDFLPKPIDISTLISRMHEALASDKQ